MCSPGGRQIKVICPENKIRVAKKTDEEMWPTEPCPAFHQEVSSLLEQLPLSFVFVLQREVFPWPRTVSLVLFLCIRYTGSCLIHLQPQITKQVFPGGSVGKESSCNAGDPGSIPGSGRFSGEGNANPLQYSCLGNPMDRGAWWATVHEVAKSQTQLND